MKHDLTQAFSIKNNCKTPYCSKLISEWTPFPDMDIATLAYVTIARDLFDPIVDPDLIDYDYVGRQSAAQAVEVASEGYFTNEAFFGEDHN